MYTNSDISTNVEKLFGLKSVSVRDRKIYNLLDAHWVEVPHINAYVYAVVLGFNWIIVDMTMQVDRSIILLIPGIKRPVTKRKPGVFYFQNRQSFTRYLLVMVTEKKDLVTCQAFSIALAVSP